MMTDEIEWGAEIVVNGVRPDGLSDDGYVTLHWRDDDVWSELNKGSWTIGMFDAHDWLKVDRIRLPDDHPHYAKPTLTGSNGSYYDITINGQTVSCNDVIDALGLNFNRGEAFKALWRAGRKPGTLEQYDLDKVLYFAQREANRGKN